VDVGIVGVVWLFCAAQDDQLAISSVLDRVRGERLHFNQNRTALEEYLRVP